MTQDGEELREICEGVRSHAHKRERSERWNAMEGRGKERRARTGPGDEDALQQDGEDPSPNLKSWTPGGKSKEDREEVPGGTVSNGVESACFCVLARYMQEPCSNKMLDEKGGAAEEPSSLP